ncbi:MAG: hypothetical protein ACYTGL_19450 [Planctomycetota bacterium]|jgi:hypothetical protein
MTDEEQDPDSTYSLSPSERKDKPKPIVSPECGAVFSEPARSYPSVDHVSDENRVSPPAPATGLVDGGPSEEEAEDWDRLVTHWSAGDRIQYRVRRLVTLGIWLTILGGGAWGVFAFMGGAFDYVGTPTSQHTANLQKGVLTRINPGMTLPEIRELLGTKGNWLTNLQGHEVKRMSVSKQAAWSKGTPTGFVQWTQYRAIDRRLSVTLIAFQDGKVVAPPVAWDGMSSVTASEYWTVWRRDNRQKILADDRARQHKPFTALAEPATAEEPAQASTERGYTSPSQQQLTPHWRTYLAEHPETSGIMTRASRLEGMGYVISSSGGESVPTRPIEHAIIAALSD